MAIDPFFNEFFDGLVNTGGFLQENTYVLSDEDFNLFSGDLEFSSPVLDTHTGLDGFEER